MSISTNATLGTSIHIPLYYRAVKKKKYVCKFLLIFYKAGDHQRLRHSHFKEESNKKN